MSQIQMSPDFSAGYVKRMIDFPTGTSTQDKISLTSILQTGNGGTGNAVLRLFKGTRPADFTALTTSDVHDADALVAYYCNEWTGTKYIQDFGPTDVSANPVIINTDFVSASAAGTATWFWLHARAGLTGTTIAQQLIGTVGLIGSGADLEMSDVNIVADNPYRISNLRLHFPDTWTY